MRLTNAKVVKIIVLSSDSQPKKMMSSHLFNFSTHPHRNSHIFQRGTHCNIVTY